MTAQGLTRREQITEALQEAVAAAVEFPIGAGVSPPNVGHLGDDPLGPFQPWANLHSIASATDGPIDRPTDDSELVYQFTCVGGGQLQAEWVASEIADALDAISLPWQIGARAVVHIDIDSIGPAVRDNTIGQSTPPEFLAYLMVRLFTTPIPTES